MYNSFWKDVLVGWSDIVKGHTPNNIKECLTESLWFNDSFKIDHKYVFYANWDARGIRFVNDLLDENGHFLSFEEFKIFLKVKSNFIQYNGMISCLKKNRPLLSNCSGRVEEPFIPFAFKTLFSQNKGCRNIYDVSIKPINVNFKSRLKWCVKLDIDS